MCGILGGWLLDRLPSFNDNVSRAMAALRHRGPNDQGSEWLSSTTPGHVLLGHTRLSILDLSSGGHQPMHTADGRYSMVFNGEIYNYQEIKDELYQLGYPFHSNSDTEVLLTAWCEWGVACLNRLQGMFAFVVYDKLEQTLTCVRDAFGIKPFFYTQNTDHFLFSSEQPALLALRGGTACVDWQRSYDYLVYADYDSHERTFVQDVKHLMPGHLMVFDLATAKLATPIAWWTPNIHKTQNITLKDAADAVREAFLTNIRLHLRSDVPLGAALSGGIDSSAVVCAMRYLEPNMPIHTFSYISDDTNISEEYWVDRINQHVQAIPHKLTAKPEQLVTDLDDMIRIQGEPFGSTSIYAQYCLFNQVGKAGIKVILDGQGADELMAGYYGYPGERLLSLIEQGRGLAALRFFMHWSRWPGRRKTEALLHLGRVTLPDSLYAQAGKYVGRHASPRWLNTTMLRDAGVVLEETRLPQHADGKGRRVLERLAASLQHRGLPALLRHADRNSMRFSVESRVPFLTLPMANLFMSLPEHYLISNTGETKSVFRAAMRSIVPDDVLDRRDKIGFATPEKNWLLGMAPIIRTWLQDSVDVPFLNCDALLAQFDAVVVGRAPFSWQIWRWVNFVRWHQYFNKTY